MKGKIIIFCSILLVVQFACTQQQEEITLESTVPPELTKPEIKVQGEKVGKKWKPKHPEKLKLVVDNGEYQPIRIEHSGHQVHQLRITQIENKKSWIPPGHVTATSTDYRTINLGPFDFDECSKWGNQNNTEPETGYCKGSYDLKFQWDGFEVSIDPDYRIKPPGEKFGELYDLSKQWGSLIVEPKNQRDKSWLEDNMAERLVFYKRDQEKPLTKKDLIEDTINDGNDYRDYELQILSYEELSDDLASIHGRYTKILADDTRDVLEFTNVWRLYDGQWKCVFGHSYAVAE